MSELKVLVPISFLKSSQNKTLKPKNGRQHYSSQKYQKQSHSNRREIIYDNQINDKASNIKTLNSTITIEDNIKSIKLNNLKSLAIKDNLSKRGDKQIVNKTIKISKIKGDESDSISAYYDNIVNPAIKESEIPVNFFDKNKLNSINYSNNNIYHINNNEYCELNQEGYMITNTYFANSNMNKKTINSTKTNNSSISSNKKLNAIADKDQVKENENLERCQYKLDKIKKDNENKNGKNTCDRINKNSYSIAETKKNYNNKSKYSSSYNFNNTNSINNKLNIKLFTTNNTNSKYNKQSTYSKIANDIDIDGKNLLIDSLNDCNDKKTKKKSKFNTSLNITSNLNELFFKNKNSNDNFKELENNLGENNLHNITELSLDNILKYNVFPMSSKNLVSVYNGSTTDGIIQEKANNKDKDKKNDKKISINKVNNNIRQFHNSILKSKLTSDDNKNTTTLNKYINNINYNVNSNTNRMSSKAKNKKNIKLNFSIINNTNTSINTNTDTNNNDKLNKSLNINSLINTKSTKNNNNKYNKLIKNNNNANNNHSFSPNTSNRNKLKATTPNTTHTHYLNNIFNNKLDRLDQEMEKCLNNFQSKLNTTLKSINIIKNKNSVINEKNITSVYYKYQEKGKSSDKKKEINKLKGIREQINKLELKKNLIMQQKTSMISKNRELNATGKNFYYLVNNNYYLTSSDKTKKEKRGWSSREEGKTDLLNSYKISNLNTQIQTPTKITKTQTSNGVGNEINNNENKSYRYSNSISYEYQNNSHSKYKTKSFNFNNHENLDNIDNKENMDNRGNYKDYNTLRKNSNLSPEKVLGRVSKNKKIFNTQFMSDENKVKIRDMVLKRSNKNVIQLMKSKSKKNSNNNISNLSVSSNNNNYNNETISLSRNSYFVIPEVSSPKKERNSIIASPIKKYHKSEEKDDGFIENIILNR